MTADAEVLADDRGARFEVGRNVPGHFRGDAELVRQLVFNLITNAVAVLPSGGVVSVASEHTEGRWILTVSDEGPGMPAKHIAHAFERFVRFQPGEQRKSGRPTGHGLGLPICKSIVELHGGTIQMENRTDRSGLRVTIRLPNTPDRRLAA